MWRGESLAGPGHKDAWWMTGLGHATRFLEPIRRPLEKARPFALSVAALLVLLLPLVEGLGRHSIGVDARHKDGRWVIVRIDPESTADLAGLRIGDVVLALDGVPPGSRRITDPGLALSAARELTVLRGTEPLTLHLNPAQARWHHVIEPMLMQLVALVFWSLAAFVRIVKPKDDLALRFQWLNLAIALILAFSSAADDDIIWAKVLNVLAFSLLPALFLGFFLRFAQGTPLTRQGFFLIHGLAFAGLAVGALYLATGLLASNWYDLLRALLLIPSALAFFGGLMLLVRAHSRSRSRHTRQQLRVVLVGTAVAVLDPRGSRTASADSCAGRRAGRCRLSRFFCLRHPPTPAYGHGRRHPANPRLRRDDISAGRLLHGVPVRAPSDRERAHARGRPAAVPGSLRRCGPHLRSRSRPGTAVHRPSGLS